MRTDWEGHYNQAAIACTKSEARIAELEAEIARLRAVCERAEAEFSTIASGWFWFSNKSLRWYARTAAKNIRAALKPDTGE